MDDQLIGASYDRFAQRYDEIFVDIQRPKLQGLIAALPALPEPILDAGSGTGLLARTLRRRTFQVDISQGMLRCARPARRRLRANLSALPFPNETFGTVFSVTSLLDFAEPPLAIWEFARVLRAGGLLAVSVLKSEPISHLEDALVASRFERLSRLDLGQDIGFVCRHGKGGRLGAANRAGPQHAEGTRCR